VNDAAEDKKPTDKDQAAMNRPNLLLGTSSLVAAVAMASEALAQAQKATPAQAASPAASSGRKPNILVIFGDDIGQPNVSASSFGLMGYRTPNIDRLAREGMMFTDYYAEQSCTAGRSSFITGQCTLRTARAPQRCRRSPPASMPQAGRRSRCGRKQTMKRCSRLFARYTMERERDVHRDFLRGIGLTSSTTTRPVDVSQTADDGIELF
jgi:hypothetical protein